MLPIFGTYDDKFSAPPPLRVYLQVQRLARIPGLHRETMIRGEPENVKFRNKRDRKSCKLEATLADEAKSWQNWY